jgi:hypothetical protein
MGLYRVLLVGLILVNPACSPGQQGPPGAAGPTGPAGSTGGIACTPGSSFCDGASLWTCTRSGADAVGGGSCTAWGSASNPGICATTHCLDSAAACCRAINPTQSWNLSSPISTSGDTYGYVSPSGGCASAPLFISFSHQMSSCPYVTQYVSLSIARPFTVGQAISLPSATVSLYVWGGPGGDCSAWTGAVTVSADIPSYTVSVNATCSQPGQSGLRVVGTLSGNL